MKQRDWQAVLLRIAVVLGALLALLGSLILLYILFQVVLRFGSVLTLFILGALIAYILNPAVTWVAARAGKRWVGTLAVYLAAAAGLAILSVLLVQPLVSESSSLIRAVRNPSASSVQVLTRMASRSHTLRTELRAQRVLAAEGRVVPQRRVHQARAVIVVLQDDLAALGAVQGHARPKPQLRAHQGATTPQPHIRVPPSYLTPLHNSTGALASDYQRAIRYPTLPELSALTRSIADADRVTAQAQSLHTTLSTTPILLLDAQTWADDHHIGLDVTQSAGQVVRQITSQVSSLLNNTAAILSQTATVFLDLFLVLIISVYFVIDGESMVQRAVGLIPATYHKQATFFATSLDSVLGGYIRAQVLLALLAGVLAGVGAAVMGVPFALVIGVSTFVLQLVPVIGPMLVYIVPTIIALLFTPIPTPLIFLAYFVVFEQVVTNVIGPRVNSKSVGIHPLEAMAAALVAYPVAGVLGSFLAVPLVGFIHVVAKEARRSWQSAPALGKAAASPVSKQDASPTATDDVARPSETSKDGNADRAPLLSHDSSREKSLSG